MTDDGKPTKYLAGHLLPLSRILAFLRFKARHRAIFNPGADQRTYQRRRIPRRGPDGALNLRAIARRRNHHAHAQSGGDIF